MSNRYYYPQDDQPKRQTEMDPIPLRTYEEREALRKQGEARKKTAKKNATTTRKKKPVSTRQRAATASANAKQAVRDEKGRFAPKGFLGGIWRGAIAVIGGVKKAHSTIKKVNRKVKKVQRNVRRALRQQPVQRPVQRRKRRAVKKNTTSGRVPNYRSQVRGRFSLW